MENNNTILSSKVQTGTMTLTGLFAFFVLVIALAVIAYFHYQQFLVKRKLTEIQSNKAAISEEINLLKVQNVEAVFQARKALDAIEQKEIKWSTVIRKLIDATPQTIFYSSYSGNETGEIVLSANAPSFEELSKAIKALSASTSFSNVFVPTIARGITEEEKISISFSVRLKYTGEKTKRS